VRCEPSVAEGEEEGEMQLGPGRRRHVEGAPGPQRRETQRRGDEHARPVGPEVVVDDRERLLRSAADLTPPGRIRPEEIDNLVPEQPPDIPGDGRVPAHELVAPERPGLARLDVQVRLGWEIWRRVEVVLCLLLREDRARSVSSYPPRSAVLLFASIRAIDSASSRSSTLAAISVQPRDSAARRTWLPAMT
jgi:hypothetical protein